MKPAEIYAMAAEFQPYLYKHFQANLRSLQTAIKEEDTTLPPWQVSVAKEKIVAGLFDGTIAYDADPKTVHESDDDYKKYPFRKFKSNFARLCLDVKEQKKKARFCDEALKHDRAIHPTPLHGMRNFQRVPRWEGSDAQKELADDIASNKHTTMTPSELQASRASYSQFPTTMFRNHIYQEEKSVKFRYYLSVRAFKKKDEKEKKQAEYEG